MVVTDKLLKILRFNLDQINILIKYITVQALELILQSKDVYMKFADNNEFKIDDISVQEVIRTMS